MTAAQRIRILSIRLADNAAPLRGFADLLERGEVPDRQACARFAALLSAIVHDCGELGGLSSLGDAPNAQSACPPGDVLPQEGTEQLVAEIEGREPDPPGRPTPQEKPTLGTWSK